MKKFLLSMFFVLTATLGIQAQKVSLDFTSNTWGLPEASANKAVDAATFTSGDYSVTLTGSTGNGYYFNTDGYLMLGKNGASLALPAFDFAVSKIEVVGRTGASTGTLENIYVGETAVSTQCKGSATTNSFQIAESHQAAGNVYVLKIESKHNAQITTINIYEASSEPTEPEGGETPEEPETPSSDYLNETFATDLGLFTTQETVGNYPWVFAKNYGAKASGYANGASQDAESWLISPAMDLTGETKASIAFDYVINKGDVNAAATNHKLLITSNYTGDVTTTEWTEVEYGAVNNGNWTFNNTGNIALPESMMDKPAVVIAFKYVSTTENSSTWEIKNVVVSGEKGATVDPEEPEGGEGEGEGETEVTYLTIAEVLAAGGGEAATKGTVVATYARGFLMDDGTGSILVYLGSDNGYAAGDAVTVSGKTSVYGGLLQFGNTSVVEKTGTATVEHPTATVMDGAAMDAYLAAPAIQYVEYTGTLTISDKGYYNVAVDGAATAVGSIQYPQDAIKANLTSGSVVKVTGYTIGVSSSKYVNTMVVKVETVDNGGNEGEGEGEEIEVTDISDIIDAGAGKAKAQGTIVATYARGFLLDDGTGSILVYLGTDNGHAAGDIVTVEGATSMYGGLLQFGNTSVVEKLTTTTVTYPTATAIDGAAMDAYLTAPEIKYVEYTGTLTINESFYNVAIEGAATAIGSIQYPQDNIKNSLTTNTTVKVTGYLIGVSGSKYVNTMAVKVETVGEGGGEEPEEPEVPTETQEYTVTEALAAYVDGKQIPAIVTGYIVGAVNSAPETGSQFGTDATNATNILISDNADTNDYKECLIVQLPSGDIRSALNLVGNPGNYKKQVKITGSVEKYFRVAGLKTVTAYEFTGVTGVEKVEIRNEKSEIYDLTGRRVETITAPGIYIVNGKKVLVR